MVTASNPPAHFNFAEDVLDRMAEEHPGRTALVWVDGAGEETRWSFELIREQSSRLAHVVRASGVGRGDIVLVMVASVPHRLIAQLAVMRAGGVSLLVRHGSSSRELRHHLGRTAPALAIIGPEAAAQLPPDQKHLIFSNRDLENDLGGVPSRFESLRLKSSEPAQLALTGGTTGLPKMVVHTHGSKLFHYLRWTASFAPDDLCWDFAGRWWMGAWRHGVPIFDAALPVARGRDATSLVIDMLSRYPITRFMATPRLYRDLVEAGTTRRTLRTLRCCWSSGQPLDWWIYRAWSEATGIALHDRYSQTECGEAPLQCVEGIVWTPGCIGRPFPWIDMAVIDAGGRRLPAGEQGDIAIKVDPERPQWLFREYWNDPEATAVRHRSGWYLTGDLGRINQTGFFFITGRTDDVINCGGENIGPYELESILHEHAAVRDAAVIGKRDRNLGEVPKAFVVPASGRHPSPRLAEELMQFVNESIHPLKRLREIEFVDALPVTAGGKTSRRELSHASDLGDR